jgi:hypothetical protein
MCFRKTVKITPVARQQARLNLKIDGCKYETRILNRMLEAKPNTHIVASKPGMEQTPSYQIGQQKILIEEKI